MAYTNCDACGRLFTKGNYCPVCLKVSISTNLPFLNGSRNRIQPCIIGGSSHNSLRSNFFLSLRVYLFFSQNLSAAYLISSVIF